VSGKPARSRIWVPGVAILLAASAGGCDARSETPTDLPSRIIAVAPNVAETLFALDLGDRVVGVGDHCRWPPEAAARPKVGGLYDPRMEAITLLDPDLAVLLPSEEVLARHLRRLGVEVLTVKNESLTDFERAVEEISARAGVESEGRKLLGELRDRLAPRATLTGSSVLLIVARQPGRLEELYIAGPGTFLDELLDRLGAANALSDSPLRYPQLGPEEILRRRPQVIVELQPEPLSAETRKALLEDWRKLGGVEGFDPCVTLLEGDHVLVPGPRLPRVYEELERAVLDCRGRR
jgi:iron complex transport system substrate-binding protein